MSSGPTIEFVYFDLGNVLVSFDPKTACRNVAELLNVSEAAADEAIYGSGLQDRFERGEVSPQQYVNQVACRLRVDPQQIVLSDLMQSISDMFVPIESMALTIESVRRRGVRFGLLSNTCSAHWNWVTGQNWSTVDQPFQTTILSYEIGAMKPDPKIYHVAQKAADVAPEKILFLDDREENIAEAQKQLWNAVQCVGGPEAENALRDFGVIP